MSSTNWSKDYEDILDKIRINSINLNKSHMKNYFYYKQLSKYFQIPTIILSSFNSVFSVGFTYTSQENVSSISALVSLIVSIINSVQLYLKIDDQLESENSISKSYYTLSSDIYKVLELNEKHRPENPHEILEEYYNRYIELLNQSNLLNNNSYTDKLLILPKEKKRFGFNNNRTNNEDSDNKTNNKVSSDTSVNSTEFDNSPRINFKNTPFIHYNKPHIQMKKNKKILDNDHKSQSIDHRDDRYYAEDDEENDEENDDEENDEEKDDEENDEEIDEEIDEENDIENNRNNNIENV